MSKLSSRGMPESRSARPLSLKIEVFSRIKDILCKVEARTGQTLVETLGAAISLMNALRILMVVLCTVSMAPGAQSLRRTLYDVILLTPVQRLAR